MPVALGTTIAGYTILRLLGSGGMSEVYLAQHPRLPRRDALKIMSEAITADTDFRERFNREADLTATLWHPNIVSVHDRGDFDGHLWIAMDYVQGTDAGQLLIDRYPAGMPVRDACAIVTAVADALDHAHKRGLLHRDVKPANILLSEPDEGERRIVLADFGIARPLGDISGLTATNLTIGTVTYAAPEQLMGEEVDSRADQYALAATAYQLLTGSRLFPYSNPAVVISQHLNASPPAVSQHRPELADLDAVLAKALSKAPTDRYMRCTDFARALADKADAVSQSSPSAPTAQAEIRGKTAVKPRSSAPSSRPSEQQAGSRRRLLILAAAAVIVVVAGAATMWTSLHHSSARGPENSPSSTSSSAGPVGRPPSVSTFPAPTPRASRPVQGNCPPSCTQIPDSAWVASSAVPLYNNYSWAPLAPLSEPVSNSPFKAEEVCATGPAADDERANRRALAARITLPNPPGQWQLQAQIVHWRGDPWTASQMSGQVMDSITNLLRNDCSIKTPGVSVSGITQQNRPGGHLGSGLAAVITQGGTTPRVLHEYLFSDTVSSTLVELALWATSPTAIEWPTVNDDDLLAAMAAPLCTAYVNSCMSS